MEFFIECSKGVQQNYSEILVFDSAGNELRIYDPVWGFFRNYLFWKSYSTQVRSPRNFGRIPLRQNSMVRKNSRWQNSRRIKLLRNSGWWKSKFRGIPSSGNGYREFQNYVSTESRRNYGLWIIILNFIRVMYTLLVAIP